MSSAASPNVHTIIYNVPAQPPSGRSCRHTGQWIAISSLAPARPEAESVGQTDGEERRGQLALGDEYVASILISVIHAAHGFFPPFDWAGQCIADLGLKV